MTTVQIVRAETADAAVAADVIGAAFQTLAPAEWLVPNPTQRAFVLPANFRIHVEHAVEVGEVHMTADRSAVAVWLPRDRPLPGPARYDTRLALACGQWADRFRALDSLSKAYRPTLPHHHLTVLAVRPDRQGRGLGSALLRHYHALLDEQRMPAYLEASSPRSRDLYLRHGYQLYAAPFTVPNGAPLWPMWRQPVSQTAPPSMSSW